MKIFISHSSRDKWIARRISQDLSAIGVETFLDEKDIETGAPIDETINNHLKDCDDCLMLLSPSALNSPWVLIEIGGAKALGKRLIPILLHVGANELPAPIAKHLARDLNEVDRYYDEVRRRLAGELIVENKSIVQWKGAAHKSISQNFKVGDRVRIISSPEQAGKREELLWVDEMNRYAGETGTIVSSSEKYKTAFLDIDEGEFIWAWEWLSKE